MIDNFKVTVIIPLYNSEKSIIGTLNSICQQTRSDLIDKIIVVNDGSTDESYDVVKNHVKDFMLPIQLICKENGGVSSARNIGIKEANTDWIAFCDADDIWLPDKLDIQYKTIIQDNPDLIGGNHTDKELRIGIKRISEIHQANVKELCLKMFPQTSTIIVKKKVCEEFGFFDESQRYAEDGNLFMKIAAKYKYIYIPDQVTVYDGGRRGFGVSGLSSNLKGMYEGNKKNLDDLYALGYISVRFKNIMRIFYFLKYLRRIFITKVGGNKVE